MILLAKEKVAKQYGYPDNIMGTSWEYAMMCTHRTKRQLFLYDEVIRFLSDVIILNEEERN